MTNRDKIKYLCNIAENFDKSFDVEKTIIRKTIKSINWNLIYIFNTFFR